MKVAMGFTTVLLLTPLLVSWHYNLSHPDFWFIRAGAFVVLILVLLWRLCLHVDRRGIRNTLAIGGVSILALFLSGRLVSFYFQGKSYNEEFFFHFSTQTAAFALNAFPGLIILTVIYLILAGSAGYFSIYRAKSLPLGNRTLLVPPAILLALVLDPDLALLAETSMRDANTSGDIQLSTIDWEAEGLNRNALYKVTDEITAGKNVVMIYLEGLEKMYTEPDIFPGLTPFLSSLTDTALHFDNMRQSQGATFTVAGILSSQCGTPLLFPKGPGGNDILKNGFLQEGVCFGDILHDAGYHQVFMGGASTRFAGKGAFLASHGYDEVLGKEELLPLVEDKTYLNNWGLYDDTLLSLAEDKFDELAADNGRPFNFTVLTVDTHPPDGTVSASCEPYDAIDSSIFDAVHCTDQLVKKFVDHMKRSPAWPNTVVLIMSDHLHMRNSGMEYYPPDYDRRLQVNILNTGITRRVETQGVHMDIAPTLLNLMKVKYRQAFLVGMDMLAPDRAQRWVDPNNGRRENIIRYLNTNLLSRIETGLCEAKPLYSIQNNSLRVAGREIEPSMRGRTMPLQTLNTTNALVTLVSKEGRVGLTFPVVLDNLPYVLFQFRQYNFLILASSDIINKLDPKIDTHKGLSLVFGNLEQSFTALQTGISLQQGFQLQTDCGALLDQSRQLTDKIDMDALGRICDYKVPEGTSWDDRQGLIRFNSVAYADQRFQADFSRNDKGWYAVTSLNELPQVREPGSCDAFYGNMEILVPAIQTESGPASMILKKIPGVTLTFELGEVTPFPANN